MKGLWEENKDYAAITAVDIVCQYCKERKDDCSDCIFLGKDDDTVCGISNMPALKEKTIDSFKLEFARKYVFADNAYEFKNKES